MSTGENTPYWIREGQGIGPKPRWQFSAEGDLTGLELARETGDVLAADSSGAVQRLDRTGQISALTRLPGPARLLAWSDNGLFGAAVVGESTLHRFDRDLRFEWKTDLPDAILALAISPHGQTIAVSLADGTTVVFDDNKKKRSRFSTIRALYFLKFCASQPLLIGSAEHGLICCWTIDGVEVWSEKLWNNVGAISLTGDGDVVYLAAFGHGIQAFNGEGGSVGSYVLEGTVHRVSTSYEPQRIIAATVERYLYWLDAADGQLLWATGVPDDISHVACDPLGEWAICGFKSGRLIRLDW